jgi:probable metal-binding protein
MVAGMDATASYHGHDVLHFLLETEGALSVEEMHAQVIEKFGANARFHTCSAEGMDAKVLLTFLLQRGKIVPQDDGFVVAGHRICNH